MSDSQIEAWNKKAKNGILSKNSDLKSLVNSLKSAFFTAAGGTGKTATSIGLSAGSISVSSTSSGLSKGTSYNVSSGLIELDEDALSQALTNNPDEVINMFTNGSSSSSSDDQGIMYKITTALASYKSTATDAVSNTEDKIDDAEDEIDDMEDKLDDMADRYYEKFSQMETALSKLNSESSYISQLFSTSD